MTKNTARLRALERLDTKLGKALCVDNMSDLEGIVLVNAYGSPGALSNVALISHDTIPVGLRDIKDPEVLLGVPLAHGLYAKIVAEPFIDME